MKIDDPEVIAEVRAAFDRYEAALLANEGDVLDAMFMHERSTVRYGINELQYGIEAIRAFRAVQKPFERDLDGLLITTFGTDFAIASTLFRRPDLPGQVGRQQQSWVKLHGQWRVAAAHVSMMPEPAGPS